MSTSQRDLWKTAHASDQAVAVIYNNIDLKQVYFHLEFAIETVKTIKLKAKIEPEYTCLCASCANVNTVQGISGPNISI
jgi:hypothetical protein